MIVSIPNNKSWSSKFEGHTITVSMSKSRWATSSPIPKPPKENPRHQNQMTISIELVRTSADWQTLWPLNAQPNPLEMMNQYLKFSDHINVCTFSTTYNCFSATKGTGYSICWFIIKLTTINIDGLHRSEQSKNHSHRLQRFIAKFWP